MNPFDNFVKYGEGTTSSKKNTRKINLEGKIFWQHVSVAGLGVHIFHRVLKELRWIKWVDGVQVKEGQKLLHERCIGLILVDFSTGGGACALDADKSW